MLHWLWRQSSLAVLLITLLAMQSYYGLQTYNFNKLNICLGSTRLYGNRTLNSQNISKYNPLLLYIKSSTDVTLDLNFVLNLVNENNYRKPH